MSSVEAFLAGERDAVVWELFHENSKTSRVEPHLYFGRHPSDDTVVHMMRSLREVKPYADRDKLALPAEESLSAASVDDAQRRRRSARGFGGDPMRFDDLAALLRRACGVTRDNTGTQYPRSFRASPSGGALYPLELHVWARAVEGVRPGVYHYDPHGDELDVLGDAPGLPTVFVQRHLVEQAAVVLLFSAVFIRSVFKYGERGYRFVLIEAGHVAQNVLLAGAARGLVGVPLGGYFDRELDRLLGFNGIDESVVYALAVGSEEGE